MSVKETAVASDVFRWRGLGKSSWRVWRALGLAAAGIREAELVGRLGMSAKTVRRALHRLKRHGLAQRDDAGCWHHRARDVDEVARELGIAGTGERQRRAHQQQRQAYIRLQYRSRKYPR